jgi:hypothetical protein
MNSEPPLNVKNEEKTTNDKASDFPHHQKAAQRTLNFLSM